MSYANLSLKQRAAGETSDSSGSKHFGIGLGTIVLSINVFLPGSYTFGCHSLRHAHYWS
jgi:hypothetical protein